MTHALYDSASRYYDDTHGYLPGTAARMARAAVRASPVGPSPRLLEVGAGTGRLGCDLAPHASQYVGVDISRPLLDIFSTKLQATTTLKRYASLCRAEGSRLPFGPHSFDLVCIVHVLHSTPLWRSVLDEAMRVLAKPGGALLLGYEDSSGLTYAQSPKERVRSLWRGIVDRLGGRSLWNRPGVFVTDEIVTTWLERSGAQLRRLSLADIEYPPISHDDVVLRTASRMYFGDWTLPDQLFQEALRLLDAEVSDLEIDRTAKVPTRAAFKALIATW
jgi:ubiquinone/menaquinone biosynthesis C-methylase UbiE